MTPDDPLTEAATVVAALIVASVIVLVAVLCSGCESSASHSSGQVANRCGQEQVVPIPLYQTDCAAVDGWLISDVPLTLEPGADMLGCAFVSHPYDAAGTRPYGWRWAAYCTDRVLPVVPMVARVTPPKPTAFHVGVEASGVSDGGHCHVGTLPVTVACD